MIKPIDENMDLVVKFLASWVDKTTEIKYRIKIHTTQGILKICISNILRLYESLNNVSLKHGISHYETAIIQYIQRQLANILPSQTAISKETFESAYTTILKYIKCRKNNLSKNNCLISYWIIKMKGLHHIPELLHFIMQSKLNQSS